MASPSAGAPALKYGDVNTVTPFPGEVKGLMYYDNILQNIENKFTSDDYDTSNIDGGQDEIITNGKITTTLTTSENQKK